MWDGQCSVYHLIFFVSPRVYGLSVHPHVDHLSGVHADVGAHGQAQVVVFGHSDGDRGSLARSPYSGWFKRTPAIGKIWATSKVQQFSKLVRGSRNNHLQERLLFNPSIALNEIFAVCAKIENRKGVERAETDDDADD
jgi:hypothetical protein